MIYKLNFFILRIIISKGYLKNNGLYLKGRQVKILFLLRDNISYPYRQFISRKVK